VFPKFRTSRGHVGILNTIRQAQEVSGIKKLHALIRERLQLGDDLISIVGRRRPEMEATDHFSMP
jgi:hypothetical protein